LATNCETHLTQRLEGCLLNLQKTTNSQNSFLTVKDLSVKYRTYKREIKALRNVSLEIRPSQIIAIVGESGCGKSTLGLSIINLLPIPPAQLESGEILFRNTDLLKLQESDMARMRGTAISMIFQQPMSSLDPVYRVADQLAETIEVRERREGYGSYHLPHQGDRPREPPSLVSRLLGSGLSGQNRLRYSDLHRQSTKHYEEIVETLREVQIPDPVRVLERYPHQLSGGMAQRVMIAQALLERPSLLIADEPTSALDVTTQAQVLSLLRRLRDETQSSVLFITHDLSVAAQIADRVVVMYAGEVFEDAAIQETFTDPLHPYTEGLIRSFPRLYKNQGKLESIAGEIPDLRHLPTGCIFNPRCKYTFEPCLRRHPTLVQVRPQHFVRCFLRSDGNDGINS
jgi:oligopeptide/dipeptide ABC transporter ATP-binding protein